MAKVRSSAALLETVNKSGFPLQIGVEQLVASSTEVSSAWEIRYREHHWQHPSTGGSGFIDLVLSQNSGVGELVLECKRFQESDWIFIQREGSENTVVAKGLVSINKPQREVLGWHDLDVITSSPCSEYCVIAGDGRSMLENIAAEVLESAEALAAEDTAYKFPSVTSSPLRAYFAVIVTTASLKMCTYDPKLLDASSGKLEGTFSTVPYVRFRKQLSAKPSPLKRSMFGIKPQMVARAKESTVFVVNVDHLLSFLRRFFVQDGELIVIHDEYHLRRNATPGIALGNGE